MVGTRCIIYICGVENNDRAEEPRFVKTKNGKDFARKMYAKVFGVHAGQVKAFPSTNQKYSAEAKKYPTLVCKGCA